MCRFAGRELGECLPLSSLNTTFPGRLRGPEMGTCQVRAGLVSRLGGVCVSTLSPHVSLRTWPEPLSPGQLTGAGLQDPREAPSLIMLCSPTEFGTMKGQYRS